MKKKLIPLACAAAMTAMPAAQAEISANIGVTSNYLWRGVTQSNNGAAVSGGIDYSHESGFYLGTWASSIDWGTPGTELDFYGGFAGEANGLGYDVGLIYYMYPETEYDGSDFVELYASLSYGAVTGGFAYTIDGDAPDTSPWSEGDMYYYISAGYDLAEDWSIGATVGYYDFDTAPEGLDYAHGQIDLTKSAGDFGDFTFTVSKAGENSGDDDTKFLVSWSKSF